ncbi:MAG TPA: pitrilysin family protein [Vicinamibacterales bacterium]|nr:pitrilysin family protein [Vicinamibacterales bacterium]
MTLPAGLSPIRTTLENGLVTVVKETRKTPIVAINLAVRSGAVCDPPDAPGTMELLARVLDRGTATRSAADIAEVFDSRGVSLSISVTRHLVQLVCTCLVEDFDEIFAVIGDVVMHPSFPESELTTRKGQAVTAIRQDEDNPFVCASEGLMEALYGAAHPYGRRIKGSVQSVDACHRDSVAALHRDRFAPAVTTAVIVGDVQATQVQALVADVFGAWHAPEPPDIPLPPVTRATKRSQAVHRMMAKSQADIAYGFTSIARADPRYNAYWLMNHVMGQYAIGGRLGDSIRERQGMAYYAGSAFEANIGPGPLFVRAGVNPANVDRAIASIDEELNRARKEGLAQTELDDSRNFLIGSMPRSLETNHGIAQFLQTSAMFGLGLDFDVRLPGQLRAVTLADANAALLDAFDPSRATIIIAGPYGTP